MKTRGAAWPAHRAPFVGLAILLAGCGGEGAASRRGASVVTRLIPPDDRAVESRDLRLDLDLAPSWQAPIDGPADLAAWSFRVPSPSAAFRPRHGAGIDLGPLHKSTYLVWTGRLAADDVDLVRFRFREPIFGQVELHWNGAGEAFAGQRHLLKSPDPSDPRRVAFDLSDSGHWRSVVTRIGVRLLEPPPPGEALLAAEGLRYVRPPNMGGGEARYVTLDGRSMQGWLSRPASTIRRRVEVPSGGVVRFHAASILGGGGAATIRVLAEGGHGSRVLLERELQRWLDPPRWRWTGFEADLREFAGQTVDLLFEAAPSAPGSLVAWGNPLLTGAAGESRPNIVLVSLDTVRADHLSLYGYPRATTPGLAAWAGRWATVFETAVASAPWTLPSHVSMLSGVDAVHHGINRHGPVVATPALLPERLREAGYATYATTAGVLLTPQVGFARGFDEFDVRAKVESLPDSDQELAKGVDDALTWLNTHAGQRFFLFFHTYEAHTPYQAREPYFKDFGGKREALNAGGPVWEDSAGADAGVRPRSRLFQLAAAYAKRALQPSERELVTALYDSGLAHIDRQLGRLFGHLEAAGLLENTVVVVTSDHGESLFEHGLVGHSSLYDHDLLIPLVIAAPIEPARGRRVSAQVRSVDIAPTLMELAGLAPLASIDGSSLVPFLRGEAAPGRNAWSYGLSTVRGVSLRTAEPPRKLIAQDTVFDPFRGQFEEYDLLRDPGELQNLTDSEAPRKRAQLLHGITAGAAAVQIKLANEGPGELTGGLTGTAVDYMVTSSDLSFSCCSASAMNEFRFRVPPGASLVLMLQDRAAGGTLALSLAAAGRSWQGSLLPVGTSSRLRVAFEGGRWQASDAGAQPRTGAAIQLPGRQEVVPGKEEELLSKLRALGYVR